MCNHGLPRPLFAKSMETMMSQQFDRDAEQRDIITGDDWAGEEDLLVAEDALGAPGADSVEEVQVDFDRLDAGDDADEESDGSEDNPYLDSDEILLDDSEEAAVGRSLVPPED